MSVAELKRCFECGATYPQEVLACENDATPLCFDTVGRRWKIEDFLGRRPGGAVFAAFHLVTGQRAVVDLLSGENARDATALTRFQQELQALRLLDQNKGILKLIEDGTERDGSRFLVSELNQLRLLPELLIERRQRWLRPSGSLCEPSEAAHLIRPILSLLSTGARLGMAHGSLDASQIYVGSENDFAGGLGMLAHVKLHGLAALGMGPQLREAQAADLLGLARVLYELCTGKPPPAGELVGKDPLPETLSGPVGQVALRALGAAGPPYATAEEMQRALSSAAPSGFNAPISVPQAVISVPVPPPSQPAMQSYRSLPPAPSAPGVIDSVVSAGGTSLPPVRLTTQHSAMPTPLSPVAGLPQRSGLTSELHQVSILDLMREMKEQQESAAREETLARSRYRPSNSEIKVFVPPVSGAVDENGLPLPEPAGAIGGVGAASDAAGAGEPPAAPARPPSGESLDPTRDARELPLRPESASSARVTVRAAEAVAPSAVSGGSPAPSALSGRSAASARSAVSGRLAAPGGEPTPGEPAALPASAASSPRPPSAVSSPRPPSAASSPRPPSAASSPRPPSLSIESAVAAASSTSSAGAGPDAGPEKGSTKSRRDSQSYIEDAPTEPQFPAARAAASPPKSPVPAVPPAAVPATAAAVLPQVPRAAWVAILGTLALIILGLLIKLLTRS